VVFDVPEFLSVRVADKTTIGFTVETDITFTGSIGFDVFVDQPSDAYGILSFDSETTKPIAFTNPFPNTDYRVFFSTEEFLAIRAINKTVNGFDVDVGITYTGDIGYDVMVNDTSGVLSFAAETSKQIIFPRPLFCDAYRVALSLEDFVAARVVEKTCKGFTVEVDVTYTGNILFEVFV